MRGRVVSREKDGQARRAPCGGVEPPGVLRDLCSDPRGDGLAVNDAGGDESLSRISPVANLRRPNPGLPPNRTIVAIIGCIWISISPKSPLPAGEG